jgi:hypothetical protein
VLAGLAVVVVGACGGGSPSGSPPPTGTSPASTSAVASSSAVAAAAHCRRVPRRTVFLIASHAPREARFNLHSAAAVDAGGGFAVSVATVTGGTRRIGTWFVDDLRAPRAVTSGNVQALQVTNWPLEALAAEPAGQSRNCATKALRGPGPR